MYWGNTKLFIHILNNNSIYVKVMFAFDNISIPI